MEFLIVYKDLVSQIFTFACKLFYLFRSIIIPVWIFTAAHIFFIFFTQWQRDCLLHGFICSSTTDVWLKSLSFNTFFMIFLNSLFLNPKLIFVIIIETIFRRLRIESFDWKYLISLIFDSNKKGWKIEIWDDLWHSFIGTIEIVPHAINFS